MTKNRGPKNRKPETENLKPKNSDFGPRISDFGSLCPLLLAVAATVVSLAIYGYDFGTSGQQAQVIPLIWKYQEPNLYPNDIYMVTAANYPSIFWRSVAFLGNFIDTEKLCFWLFLLIQFAVYFGLIRLSTTIFTAIPSYLTGIFTTILALFSPHLHVNSIVSGVAVFPAHLSHTAGAWALAIFSLSALLKHKNVRALLLGAGSAIINAVVGIQTLGLILCCLLQRRQHHYYLKRHRKYFILAGIVIITLISICASAFRDNNITQALRLWWPRHYFSSSWGLAEWRDVFTFVLLAIFLPHITKINESQRSYLTTLLAGIGIFWGLGYVAEITRIRPLLILQFFRADSFLVIIVLILAAGFLAEQTISGRPLNYLICAWLIWSLCRWGPDGHGSSLVCISTAIIAFRVFRNDIHRLIIS